jgi:ABC-type phosphate transport system ATPase subunit
MTNILEGMVLQIISSTIFDNVFIAPAERSAINIFSRQLSIKRNLIVDRLLEYKDKRKSEDILNKAQRYPLPIRDSLEIAEDVSELQKNKSEYAFLADKIEEELLKGKIKISKEGSVQFNPSKSKVKNLEIHLTASIVKSLSNLVFYFRHLARKGDFIIIDEPELNLHPDNQRKIARLICEFINHGFKVMISTHSDYIIREINNLIMLKSGGEKAENLIAKYAYNKEQLIDYKRVGAYLFYKNKNVSIDVSDSGFEIDTINDEINSLNNAAEEIYFTLFD